MAARGLLLLSNNFRHGCPRDRSHIRSSFDSSSSSTFFLLVKKFRIVPLEDFSPNLFLKIQSRLFNPRRLNFYFYQLPNFSDCTPTVPRLSQVIYDLFIIAPIVLTIIITAIFNFLAKGICQFRKNSHFPLVLFPVILALKLDIKSLSA